MKVDSLEFLFPDGCQAWKMEACLCLAERAARLP